MMLVALLGGALGLGAFTFTYAEGFSYFSTEPAACANCHIMNDQFASWTKGPHHGAARCVDCHLPTEFVPKYIAKALNGYHHSKGFTLQDFHEPILIKPHNSRILQANCLRCHKDFVHGILSATASPDTGPTCVSCHRSAGHGS